MQGWFNHYGVAYNTTGNTATTGVWNDMGVLDGNTIFLATQNAGSLPTGTAVVMSNGTTLDLSVGTGNTIGSLADDANHPTGHRVLLGNNTLTTGGDGTNTVFSGVISGAGGGLTKVGNGTFTLTNTSTYTGLTTVSAGTLKLGTGVAGQDGAVSGNIANNAALVFSNVANQTYGG